MCCAGRLGPACQKQLCWSWRGVEMAWPLQLWGPGWWAEGEEMEDEKAEGDEAEAPARGG